MDDRAVRASCCDATGRRHVVLRGPLEERVAAGLAAIDELLAEGWDLAAPRLPLG